MRDELSIPGLLVVEHSFDVPLDYDDPQGQRISVFAPEVADPELRI